MKKHSRRLQWQWMLRWGTFDLRCGHTIRNGVFLNELSDTSYSQMLRKKCLLGSKPQIDFLMLRDAFPAQHTIWILPKGRQKAPAGRFSGSRYNLICQKGPCGTIFLFKIQFYLPKRPCGMLFGLDMQVYPPKKPPAGRFSGSKAKRLLRHAFPAQNTN